MDKYFQLLGRILTSVVSSGLDMSNAVDVRGAGMLNRGMPVVHIVDRAPLATVELAAIVGAALRGDGTAAGGRGAWQPQFAWQVRVFRRAEDAAAALTDGGCAVLIAGPEALGHQAGRWLDSYRGADAAVQVLVVTEAADHDATVRANATYGAVFQFSRPFDSFEVAAKVRNAAERYELAATAQRAERRLAALEGNLSASRAQAAATEAELESTHHELATATERLVAAEQLAAVGRVASGIAHELTRQLTLVSYAEAIKSRVGNDPQLVELAETIVCAHKRIAAMVDEIRDFAAALPTTVAREPADVCAVIEDALSLLRYDRDASQRLISRRYLARPLANLDRHKFSQVVINLVHNAVLATEDQDEIIIEVDALDDERAEIQIVDRGEGMSKEVVARLGEPFFTTRGAKGSGLGVGICARIIEEHGGSLRFESTPGEGTSAIVVIPQIPLAAARRRP